jgi:hypothetical protein
MNAETTRFDIFGEIVNIHALNKDGRVFVQARPLLETLGYVVGWDDTARTVTVRRAEGKISDLESALKVLQSAGVMNNPDYWRGVAGDVRFLAQMFINVANRFL